MPAWPVNATCGTLVAPFKKATDEGRKVKPAELVAAAAKITDMAFGYDGKTCIPDFVEGACITSVINACRSERKGKEERKRKKEKKKNTNKIKGWGLLLVLVLVPVLVLVLVPVLGSQFGTRN